MFEQRRSNLDSSVEAAELSAGRQSDRRLALGRPTRTAFWLLAAAYLIYLVLQQYGSQLSLADGERPLYTDFTHKYAASLLLRTEPVENLFIDDRMTAAMHDSARAAYGPALTGRQLAGLEYSPWLYPPAFIFFVLLLAFVPYWPAYALWMCMTLIPYIAAMRTILRSSSAWPLALAAPPAFHNAIYGQTGFLSGGLIGLGLAQLHRRPALAGVFIGLASVKPHLGLLIPLALAAGGYWQTFAIATVTVVALIVASAGIFGVDPWYEFIGSTELHLANFGNAIYSFELNGMASVSGTFALLNASPAVVKAAQQIATGAAGLTVAWVWWQGRRLPSTLGLRSAILCLATPLAVPLVYIYDLVLIVPAIAWIWADLKTRASQTWEFGVLLCASGALLFAFHLAKWTGVQISAACLLALLALAIKRFLTLAQDPST